MVKSPRKRDVLFRAWQISAGGNIDIRETDAYIFKHLDRIYSDFKKLNEKPVFNCSGQADAFIQENWYIDDIRKLPYGVYVSFIKANKNEEKATYAPNSSDAHDTIAIDEEGKHFRSAHKMVLFRDDGIFTADTLDIKSGIDMLFQFARKQGIISKAPKKSDYNIHSIRNFESVDLIRKRGVSKISFDAGSYIQSAVQAARDQSTNSIFNASNYIFGNKKFDPKMVKSTELILSFDKKHGANVEDIACDIVNSAPVDGYTIYLVGKKQPKTISSSKISFQESYVVDMIGDTICTDKILPFLKDFSDNGVNNMYKNAIEEKT